MSRRTLALPNLKGPPGKLTVTKDFTCTQAREALFTHQGIITVSASCFSKDMAAIRKAWKGWETDSTEYAGQLLSPCPRFGPVSLKDMWALYCLRAGLDYYLHTQDVTSPRSRWIDVVNESEEAAIAIVNLAGGGRDDFNQRVKTYLSRHNSRLAEGNTVINVNPINLGVA